MVNRISREDFKVIAASLKAAYPKEDFMGSQHTFNLWYTALQDIDYPTLNKAALSYIMSNHFPPAISDIRQIVHDLESPADDIAAEEWARLMKALGHAGGPDAEEHWNRLPAITKEIIGGFSEFREWANSPTVDLLSVQRPMFIKRYEEKERILRRRGAVPDAFNPPTKQLSEQMTARLEDKKYKPGDGVAAPEDRIAALRRRLTR